MIFDFFKYRNSSLKVLILLAASLNLHQFSVAQNGSKNTGATTVIPVPDPVFKGVIAPTADKSKADFPRHLSAPAGAPNILVILLDDVGFGQTSTFGGPVSTPTLDKLAKGGLSFNRFFTTALCSPSRAALLTGRNHHSVGTGVIMEMGTGFPGYNGILPKSAAMFPKVLQGNGYSTAIFGKWHNSPPLDISPTGPFDRWPTGLGFDYFYGFNQGETHQYYPVLYRNTVAVDPPKSPEQGYHFANDMTNEAINWINNANATNPDKPWFVYYSTGAAHAPHHAPKEWREKYKGKFDQGWDKLREETFERQKKLGVIPTGTRLTARPSEIPSWDSQSADSKKVFSRLMENYAGFLAYADFELARVIDLLEKNGEIDNTLIFYIVGDNGASAEGGLEGTFNEMASLLGFNPGLKGLSDRIDEIGEPTSEPHVPVGWAWACSTPFQWNKEVASHFGGTCNPLVVHWPDGIKAKGVIRSQFYHIIDVAPTILEAAKVKAPDYVDGIKQQPIEGISMIESFNSPKAASKRTTQYFEMMGNRAIYNHGWIACSRFGLSWISDHRDINQLSKAPWELYNIEKDFSEADNLAAKNPQKLAELIGLFDNEAKKYNVYPIDVRMTERFGPGNREESAPKTSWVYNTTARLPNSVGPSIWPNSFIMTADLEIPKSGAEGVLTCAGGINGGWTFYVLNKKLHFEYNYFDFEDYKVSSPQEIPTGKVTVKAVYSSNGFNKGGIMKVFINDQPAGEVKLNKSTYAMSGEPFEVGHDAISPVSKDYFSRIPFAFTGTINKVEFKTVK